MRVVESLNLALHEIIENDDHVMVIGEDILDPYGGAFKVTKGLSTRFPNNVLSSPISEQAIVGFATGLSLSGLKPIVEIMFGDFLTLVVDQTINHISKISQMYGETISLPLIIRTPMGGRRGYGPTHSQSLEKLFFGIPGVTVVAISSYYSPSDILKQCLSLEHPIILIENKVLYAKPVFSGVCSGYTIAIEYSNFGLPTLTFAPYAAPDITIITYGAMLEQCLAAATALRDKEELACEIVVAHQLSPLHMAPLLASSIKTKRVVVVEEGIKEWGWGSEVASALTQLCLEAPIQRVGAQTLPIPASRKLEEHVLPQTHDIIQACLNTIDTSYVLQGGANDK